MEGATVQTRFTADTKDFDTKTKSVSAKISSIASSVAKGIAVATGAATVAVGKMVSDSVKAFADYEQLAGGIEKLYGDSSKKVMEYANEAFKDVGMSANKYMSATTAFSAKLLMDFGGNADKTADYANKAMKQIADNANTYGRYSVEELTGVYQSLAKGMYFTLDNLNLGFGGTKEGMEQLLARAEELSGKKYSIENFGDIIDAIQVVQDNLNITGTTANEAMKTITGSFNMTKSAWENLLIEFGKKDADLTKPIENLMMSVEKLAENLLPVIERVLIGIANALPGLIEKINVILPSLIEQVLPSLIQAVVSLVNGLIKALPSLIKTLLPPLIEGLLSITTEIIKLLPDIIIMIAEMLPSLMPQIIDAILSIIPLLIDNLPLFLSAGAQLLGGLIAGIINSIPILLARIGEIVVKMIKSFKDIDLKQIGKDILKGLWNGLSSMKDWVVEKVKSIGKSILSGLKGILGIKSPSKEFAIIGRYSILGYTEALDDMKSDVQKQIAETFSISPQVSASSGMHFSPNIINNNYVDIQQDPLGQMVNSIKTYSGGAKNDYNYGAGL